MLASLNRLDCAQTMDFVRGDVIFALVLKVYKPMKRFNS